MPRASKVKTSWRKKQPTAQQRETVRLAQQPIMGKPSGNYSPMEAYLRHHEPAESDPATTVLLMGEFQQAHIEKSHRLCCEREIAFVKQGGRHIIWVGCCYCGNVRTKAGRYA